MSRVGKYPVSVPAGVTLALQSGRLVARGKLGELSMPVAESVELEISPGSVAVKPLGKDRRSRTMWGTTRSLINGMVQGVSTGFTRSMEINGTGYRAAVQGPELVLNLGYSHDIDYAIPAGIAIVTPKPTEIIITGINKQQVGQTAAEIRDYRGPEPYKGKGVKYAGEFIFRKEGKKK